jgi:nucleoside 2-deoxyribosyltransferase
MKLYFAGPDVFRPDAREWAERLRGLCASLGHEALIPLDSRAQSAAEIYAANLAMIRQTDVVIANLNPFRGCEPDSGTCCEVGMAVALGKRVIAYIANGEALRERVLREFGGAQNHDRNGQALEDFGLPLNLMLAIPAEIVIGQIEQALEKLAV